MSMPSTAPGAAPRTAPRTAIVTGSTSGIGLGIARALAATGCNVVLNSYTDSAEDHDLAAALAAEHGIQAAYIAADMAKAANCRELVQKACARFGGLDILINNAGIQHVAAVEDLPPEKWDAILAINLSSAFHTTAAAIPHMKKKGAGRIVNIASAHGLRASPFKSAYVAAKHGVVGLTKTVALELAEHGITCNAICPGYVLTPLVEAQIPDQMKAHGMDRDKVVREVMLAKQPTREFATVGQIGETAAFLCSPAAAQITGTTISVDGGWTAQ
ncbi:D-beta-hydroxybutyrate dehydrogenase [Nitratireductor thuwali]|uniref:D-beta-hydroxybutyrate dehydrogenase n=2 Tax=Nitratireductor thuwali TaxID=2267699 RepID=A0ABY5MJ84_9HYPH|nr:D-beta-hydroxybutyrate dehydrogenase [Nitratireductor thuwali]